jgi:hypothetical protein
MSPIVAATTAPSAALNPVHCSAVLVLGPCGYGSLTLGMTGSQAIGTGLTVGTTTDPGSCGGVNDGFLRGAPTPGPGLSGNNGRLFFSDITQELIAIYAYPGVQTPQGIGIGSSTARVRAAYPDWNPVPVPGSSIGELLGGVMDPGNPNAYFRMLVVGGKVVALSLNANGHEECYQ